MRFTDSHCHLTAEAFSGDRGSVLDRAREAGVLRIICIASTPEDARSALVLADAHAGIWCTAGIHPHEVEATGNGALALIRELAGTPRCVAIGETGLDYHYDNAPREHQMRSFRAHADLAGELGLPLVVHCREAEDDTAGLIRDYEGSVRGVLHCHGGPPWLTDVALEAGWLVSFTGIVTFKSFDPALVQRIPADGYMLETDAPYLAPVPRRGKRNEPAYVPHVAEAVARIRGESVERVATDTWANAARFFGLEEAGPLEALP